MSLFLYQAVNIFYFCCKVRLHLVASGGTAATSTAAAVESRCNCVRAEVRFGGVYAALLYIIK